jgi:hypothetical protein
MADGLCGSEDSCVILIDYNLYNVVILVKAFC